MRSAAQLTVVIALASLWCTFEPARGQPDEDLRADPRLVAESPVAIPGEILWIAIDFEIDEGWHTYWPGLNDTGMAFDPVVEVSPGAMAGALVWPAPHRYESPGAILDHVFEERMIVLLPLVITPEAKPGESIEVRVEGRWLVCDEVCILEQAERSIRIPVVDADSTPAKPSPETAALFEAARARIPEPIHPEGPLVAELKDNALLVRAQGAVRIAFYPALESREPVDLLEEGEAEDQSLRVSLREGEEPVRGVVEVWTDEKTSRLFALELPEPQGFRPSSARSR